MSVRRRIGWAVAAVFGPLAAAILAAPYLVDVGAYKPALIQAVKEATGRELVIEGPMKLSLFPEPRVSARQVRFANPRGAKGAQMVDVRWVGASPSWLALLMGRVEVGSLTLYQPTIALETDANGVPNWQFDRGASARQVEVAPAAGMHLAIGRLRIVQGTITYANPSTGQTLKAEQLDGTASVGSVDGPFSISGKATVNNVPLVLDLSVGDRTAQGNEVALALRVSSGKLDFKGRASELGPKAEVKGHLAVSTGILTDFVASVVRATGQPEPKFANPVVGVFTFDGDIDYAPMRLGIGDFKMSLGGETATGSVVLEEGKAPSLSGHVALPRIEVEKWLALLKTPGAFAPPTAAGAKAEEPAKPSLSPFPLEMDVSLSLDIAHALYRGGTIRDLGVAVEIHNGVVTVPQLKAVLPGDMVLQAQTATVQGSGEISVVGPRLRDMLAWLAIDTSGVPADRLQKLELKGKLASAANGVQLSDLAIDLDDQHATGSSALVFGTPLTASASLQLDRFDLDAYLPAEPAAPAPAAAAASTAPSQPAATPATIVPPAPPLPDKTAPVLALKTKVAKLVFRGQTLGGVEGDISVQGNLLKLNSVKVADLLGAKLDLQGSIADFGTAPRYDLTFNATLPDADKVIDYAGLPRFINGRIGAVQANGGVVGTLDAFAVRNAGVTLLGTTARLTGTLGLGRNFRFDFPSFALDSNDASALLAAVTGRKQSGIGAISAAGAFKGDAQRVVFDGDLKALGTPMKGRIDAILGKRPAITANLRVPGTLDFDAWLGVSDGPPSAAPPAPAAAPAAPATASQADTSSAAVPISVAPRAVTDKPIDLSALRAFDATLNLETSAVAIASLKLLYADMQATLQNGLFRVSKLTGQFYGGAVDFNGTADATKEALALDFKGSLQGIYLGEMLRGAAGTNNFGNQHLMLSVDGKITVINIQLIGSGVSPQQIRNSLQGRGQVSGYLYPAVAAGSLGFASFATGIGSLFSTEMGFSSAVLAGFINHQNNLKGEVLLSGNTVTLKDHAVQGQNALAMVTSFNSLTAATTDTTITLDMGTRGIPDYVMTVKGPISSPTMSTRGRN